MVETTGCSQSPGWGEQVSTAQRAAAGMHDAEYQGVNVGEEMKSQHSRPAENYSPYHQSYRAYTTLMHSVLLHSSTPNPDTLLPPEQSCTTTLQ